MTSPRQGAKPRKPNAYATNVRSLNQLIASWVFGSVLLAFLLGVFVWGPEELNWTRQRLLALFCALMAGLFAFFLTGTVTFLPKRLAIRATGGIAVFVLVLLWWGSPAAPVKVAKLTPADLSARIKLTLDGDSGTGALLGLSELFPNELVFELRGIDSSVPMPSFSPMWIPRTNGFHLEKPILAVRSRTQAISEITEPSTAGIWTASVRTFTNFTGFIGAFETPSTWKGGQMEGRLTANFYRDVLSVVLPQTEKRNTFLSEHPDPRRRFDAFYHITSAERAIWDDFDYGAMPFPIRAELEVFVEGRLVGKSSGLLARVKEGDEDPGAKYVIVFPLFQVEQPTPESLDR